VSAYRRPLLSTCLIAATVFSMPACSSTPGSTPAVPQVRGVTPTTLPSSASGLGKIKHVVIIIQENRTFDNLFQGYPGADTVSRGKTSTGKMVTLKPVSLSLKYEMDHSASSMFLACNGTGKVPGTHCRNDGFDLVPYYGNPTAPTPPVSYVYVPHAESKPYFDMAHEWVLADRNFQSHLDESFVGHQFLIAAYAGSSVDLPSLWNQWGCSPNGSNASYQSTVSVIQPGRTIAPSQQVACFDYPTLADELDSAKLTWRFYSGWYGQASGGSDGVSGEWSAYQAIKHIYYSNEWKTNVISPQTKFLTDIAAGQLANVTWITPICANSDHSNCGGGYGPSWVSALVNAVGKSQFWDSTVVFVVWDDWGGLYDHVRPPHKNYDGLGFRVPLLIISPYAKKNYVSHVQYESAGILTFTEDVFGLGRLAAADARATSPANDCFDFTQTARPFVPIKAPKDTGFFMHQPYDARMPDDDGASLPADTKWSVSPY
jgi:phospholipase C